MYSIAMEALMKHTMRQHYQPRVNRMPEWLRLVWLWF